jgi:hypothetical protein
MLRDEQRGHLESAKYTPETAVAYRTSSAHPLQSSLRPSAVPFASTIRTNDAHGRVRFQRPKQPPAVSISSGLFFFPFCLIMIVHTWLKVN